MPEPLSISTLLDRVRKGDKRAQDDLFRRVYADAVELARKRVGPRIQGRVGASDIANEAIRSAFSEVEHGRLATRQRKDFLRLLRDIVRKKAARAAWREQRQKRSVERETLTNAADQAISRDLSALQMSVLKETLEEIQRFVQSEKDPVKRRIIHLGVLDGHGAPSIAKQLAIEMRGIRIPSVRSIQLQIQSARARLAERYAN